MRKIMKLISILYIIPDLSRGGSQAVLYHLVKNLPSNYDVSIYYFSEDESMKDEFEALGAKLYYMSNINIKMKFFQFRKMIKEIKPNIVHTHVPAGLFIMYLFLKLCGVKHIIATYHSTKYEVPFTTLLSETLVQTLLRTYVHVSEESNQRHSKQYRVMQSKRKTIYNGIDLPHLKERYDNEEPFSDWADGIHVIGIANFHEQKGYKFGIPAMHEIIKRHPQVYYHILGTSHTTKEIENWVRDYIKENCLEENIILHGQVDNVIKYCKSADIFLSPSEKELLPISLLEAMACKLPIIATRTGGVPEVIGSNSEYGILINSGEIKEIIDAVERLVNSTEARDKYSNLAAERIESFDVAKTMKEYYSLYHNILQ